MEMTTPDYLKDLRRRAEAVSSREVEQDIERMSVVEIQGPVHELRTHQIELELQNEELRKAQEELVVVRDELASLFDRAPVGYLSLNEKGTILKANLTISEMLGVDRALLVKQPFSAFIVPDDQDIYYLHRKTLLESREKQTCELRLHHAETGSQWVRIVCLCAEDPDGGGIRLRATVSDISELKEAEQQRKAIESQMHEAQKLESLGVMAGGIAHDFNNLLMAVLGNVDLALDDLSPVSPARESMELVRTAAKRAAELSRQMLIYSGRGSFIKQPIDLNEVVVEMTHLLESVISKKIVLKFNLARGLPAIEADATEIRQVVLNLITNASEAIDQDAGTITLTTVVSGYNGGSLTGDHAAKGSAEGKYIRLDVTDSGCGMAEETRQKIFDPFFTTKFTGRGLGLAAVHGIVRGHNGLLQVTSTIGRGTTFTVLFPSSPLPVMKTPLDEPGDGIPGRVGVVLVADDERTVRTLMETTLARAGFEVLTARDGQEAVDLFREEQHRIDVVLLDLTMPHLSGVDAFHQIRQISTDVPVLLASGYNEEKVKENFTDDHRPTRYIRKPCRPIVLVRIVQSVMK